MEPLKETTSGEPGGVSWPHITLLCAVYAIFALAGQMLSVRQFDYYPFWLPAGLFLASLLIAGKKNWVWVAGAAFAVNLILDMVAGLPFRWTALLTICNMMSGLFTAWLVVRWVSARPTLSSVQEFYRLVGLAAIGQLSGATVGAAIACSMLSDRPFLPVWLSW